MGPSLLDPALGLLSALTSLPAALYYARAFGAAAVRPVRGPRGGLAGLRQDAQWAGTLFEFLSGTALVAMVVPAINMAFAPVASADAAFGGVLVAALWPHAGERTVRALLLLLLLGAGAARVLLAGNDPAGVIAGYAIGLCTAWGVHRAMQR